MAEPGKQQIGDGQDNYGKAASEAQKAGKNIGKGIKNAGKKTAKAIGKQGAEATARTAAVTVKAGAETGKAIGKIAFTNINKVRGKNKSKDEYYTLAYSDISGEILRKEFEIIKPKIIVCCGTYNEVMHHAPDYQHIAIKMPHPGARMRCEKMLSRIAEHLVLS